MKADFRDLRDLLARRASAVLHHRQQAFLATVDSRQPTLLRQQRTIFQNMTQLPLAALAYPIDSSSLLVPHRSATVTRCSDPRSSSSCSSAGPRPRR